MSGKQSAKPRFGGVFFCLRFMFCPSTLDIQDRRARQAPVRAIDHILQQVAQQRQGGLLTLHVPTDQPHLQRHPRFAQRFPQQRLVAMLAL